MPAYPAGRSVESTQLASGARSCAPPPSTQRRPRARAVRDLGHIHAHVLRADPQLGAGGAWPAASCSWALIALLNSRWHDLRSLAGVPVASRGVRWPLENSPAPGSKLAKCPDTSVRPTFDARHSHTRPLAASLNHSDHERSLSGARTSWSRRPRILPGWGSRTLRATSSSSSASRRMRTRPSSWLTAASRCCGGLLTGAGSS
jgi:hypothetical protein